MKMIYKKLLSAVIVSLLVVCCAMVGYASGTDLPDSQSSSVSGDSSAQPDSEQLGEMLDYVLSEDGYEDDYSWDDSEYDSSFEDEYDSYGDYGEYGYDDSYDYDREIGNIGAKSGAVFFALVIGAIAGVIFYFATKSSYDKAGAGTVYNLKQNSTLDLYDSVDRAFDRRVNVQRGFYADRNRH